MRSLPFSTSDPKPSSEFPTPGELVQHQNFLNARLCALDHLPAALLREAFAGRPDPMPDKEYIIFCDESDVSGADYSNFYGGVLVDSSQYDRITTRLNAEKKRRSGSQNQTST